MQLASSLFGILVVQVKPQLEAVLNLPAGALMKEIELSSQLMDFLQTYSVPTDASPSTATRRSPRPTRSRR